MRLKERLYKTAARILPGSYRRHFTDLLRFAGDDSPAENWLGPAVILMLLFLMIIILFVPANESMSSITGFSVSMTTAPEDHLGPGSLLSIPGLVLITISAFILINAGVYLSVYFRVHDRTQRSEQALPDFLQLLSSNVRAGMTPFHALKMSARKDFGPLSEEIESATKGALSTESFTDTFMRVTRRIRSPLLERSVRLFNTALRRGGRLAQLLQDLSRDISLTIALRKEMLANTKTYTMLIMFTITFGAPILQAISIHFLELLGGISTAGASAESFGISMFAGNLDIAPSFMMTISVIMLAMISILAGMFLGVIAKGEKRYGLKYSPVILACSLTVFFLARYLIRIIFTAST